ncbi:MAG: uroporphyrinogen-III synthase [Acidimicrobiales bacterium]
MEDLPLAARRIVVTRATAQASRLVDELAERGAVVTALPLIAVDDPSDGGAALRAALGDLAGVSWLVVTSANGAARVASHLDPAALAATGTSLAAIGPGTADELTRRGFAVDLLPERFVAEGLLEAFPSPDGGGRVLLAQAAGARAVLADGLRASGWPVAVVEAYRTVHPSVPDHLADEARRADVVTFTSASTVEGWVAAIGVVPPQPAVACIGPITAAAARSAGLAVAVEADEHTIAGLVSAIVDLVTAQES